MKEMEDREPDVISDVRRMKNGDEAALARIIDCYLALVKGVAVKVLSSAEALDQTGECVNDVFFSMWQNIKKFHGETETDFRRWLCAVAKYRAIDGVRKAGREAKRTARVPGGVVEGSEGGSGGWKGSGRPNPGSPQGRGAAVAAASAEDEVILKEERRELERLMGMLSEADREIFIMKFFWGMKSDEISRRLGLSKSAVDNRIYRGRKLLAEKRSRQMRGGRGR